jgi:tRNA A37 threonylcarbamoyladenosine biosynthesis protein TsaE
MEQASPAASLRSVKPAPIPVTVVAGFLGAGKTTLVSRSMGSRVHGQNYRNGDRK